MIVSKFEPKECPELRSIIQELILNRDVKAMSNRTVKPQMSNLIPSNQPIKQFENQLQVLCRPEVIQAVKNKHKTKNMKSEMKAQQKYKQWLLNYLHKTSCVELSRGVNPISMLGTIEEPDYPNLLYQTNYRKDFPHHSNIIRPIDIQPQLPCRTVFFRKLPRPNLPDQFSTTFQNTCMKVVTVIRFVFKFLKSRAEHFEEIAEELMESVRNVKLLFDVLNISFKLEKEQEKLERLRQREKTFREQHHVLCKSYRQRIESLFQEKTPASCLIPRQQMWVNLKELHDLIVQFQYS